MNQTPPGKMMLTKNMRRWLLNYRPQCQNGVFSPVETVWTRGRGASFPGLQQCRDAGLVFSCEDDILHRGGWRHDLTPAGRAALDHGGK